MNGIVHPHDLDAWHAWSRRQSALRKARGMLRRSSDEQWNPSVFRNKANERPAIVVAASSASPSNRAALLAPTAHLRETSVAVISSTDLSQFLPGWTIDEVDWRQHVRQADVVLGDGHYLHSAHRIWAESRASSIPFFVAQHGAMTPLAPPLPPDAQLLAWSDADADFWKSGRADVNHHVVGSQLLWNAGIVDALGGHDSTSDRLTYLGQMHGAELQRSKLTRAAASFCRENDAVYRPHPSEKDKLSRLTHKAFRRAGITVDASRPLNELTGPVVSVFSTGVLEAAAQGRDAWVHFPRPPAWLEEFWERYGMHQYGDSPTPAPARPDVEPAKRIAEILTAAAR